MVTDSVRMDMRGLPAVMGRAAWQAAATDMYKTYKYDLMSISPEMTVAVTNELAYQRGGFSQGATDMKGKKTRDYSRYAAAIRKDADGKWRLAYWMGFSDSTVAIK
jgi:ketosteroid isomerase-like protein